MNSKGSNNSETMSPVITGRFIWWLNPSVILFVLLIPIYLMAWLAGEMTGGYVSTARGYYFFHGSVAWLGLAGLVICALGTLSPISSLSKINRTEATYSEYAAPWLLSALGVFSLIGYVYWFKDLLLHPSAMWSAIMHGHSFTYAIRGSLDKSAGISSLAQLGLPFLILYTHAKLTGGIKLLNWLHHRLFVLLLLAIFFRAFAWGERVAIIEAGIAIGFIWVTFANIRSRLIQRIIPLIPLLGSGGVVILFAIAEYFRSWSAYYGSKGTPFWEFVLQRLTNYYFTALNTGAGRLTMLDWPTFTFEWTLRWVHKLPIVGPVFSYYVDLRPDYYLILYGDPEFNNPSGLFSIFLDIGHVGGFLLLFFIGVLAKYTYFYLRNGTSLVGTFYFLFLMTFMEMFRYFYLGDPRSFMVICGLLFATWFKVRVKK